MSAAIPFAESGCFIIPPRQVRPAARLRRARGEIALNVTNHNYLDVVIYVVHDGQQTRVGTVPSRALRR